MRGGGKEKERACRELLLEKDALNFLHGSLAFLMRSVANLDNLPCEDSHTVYLL
jgi:hypothetical protein